MFPLASVHRVKGRNVQESEYVKMGGYHTLDLEPSRKFTLYKQEWDSISIERIENACDPTKVRLFYTHTHAFLITYN